MGALANWLLLLGKHNPNQDTTNCQYPLLKDKVLMGKYIFYKLKLKPFIANGYCASHS